MNRVVREHYPASKLPDELRGKIARDSSVKITIEEEIRQPFSATDLARQLREYRKTNPKPVTIEEAVDRIRRLRDEWDD